MSRPALIAAALVSLALPAAAAPPANLAPRTVSGWGWNVMDLEAQRAWYEANLGMIVARKYERDGKVYEYVMGFPGAFFIADPEGNPIELYTPPPAAK